MPNMGKIITGHNKKVLSEETTENRNCNCRNPDECPLEERCLTKEVFYEAAVTSDLPSYGEKA